jgi:hypothetical protein
MYQVVACDHVCSGNCRREGCNCQCGEFHQEAVTLEVQHLQSDYPTDVPSVDALLVHLAKKTGVELEPEDSEADYKPGYDDGEAELSEEDDSD